MQVLYCIDRLEFVRMSPRNFLSMSRRGPDGNGGAQNYTASPREVAYGLSRHPQTGKLISAESGRPVAGFVTHVRSGVDRVNRTFTSAQKQAIEEGLVSETTVRIIPFMARIHLPKPWPETATHFLVPEGSPLLVDDELQGLLPGNVVVAVVLHDGIKVTVLPEEAIRRV